MGKKRKVVEEKVDRIKKLALALTDDGDDVLDQLFEDVEWLVENGKDYKIHKILDSNVLPEDAHDILDFILKDIGYRLHFSVKSPEGEQTEHMVTIPFAFLVVVAVPMNKYRDFPDALPSTAMDLIAKKRLIRRAFNLGDLPTVLTDPHLYNVDHPAWLSESAVRRYLTCLVKAMQHQLPVVPLFNPKKETEFLEFSSPANQGEPAMVLVRAMCSCVVVDSDDEEQIENILFYKEEIEDNAHLEDLKLTVSQTLEQKGITPFWTEVFQPAFELYDIPYFGYHTHVDVQLTALVESAKDNLLAIAEPGKPLRPVVCVSPIVDRDDLIIGFKIEGYTGPDRQRMFFTHDYLINPQFETPDDFVERVDKLVAQLGAEKVLIVEPERSPWR